MTVLQEIFSKYVDTLHTVPDAVGEVLRNWAFVGDGYGCYSNFDIRIEFQPKEVGYREFKMLMGRDYEMILSDWGGETDEELRQEIRWFVHPNGIEMGYYWDGDGTLLFYIPELVKDEFDGTVVNMDCKKNNGWEFGEKGWTDEPGGETAI